MKNLLTLIILIVLFSMHVESQNIEISFGTGLSKNNFKRVNYPTLLSQYDKYEDKFIQAFFCGMGYNKGISKNVIGKVGIYYSKRGNKLNQQYSSYYGNSDSLMTRQIKGNFYMDYIDMPVTVHFKKLYSYIGWQASYFFRGKSVGETKTLSSYNGNIYDNKILKTKLILDESFLKNFNRIDYGVIAGVEYPFKEKYNFAVRYYQGLNRIFKDDFFSTDWNCQIILVMSYKFETRKK